MSTAVSLTLDELEKFQSLWRISHGTYAGTDKTSQKLARAIERAKGEEDK